MARFAVPGATESVSGPPSLRPPSASAFGVEDTSGLTRGIQQLGAGISDLGNSVGAVGQEMKRRRNVSQIAEAEALWTQGVIDIGNTYSRSSDFSRMAGDTDEASQRLKMDAAALITDEMMRDEWLAQAEIKRLHLVDGANDRAFELQQRDERARFSTALTTAATIVSDPTIDDGTRGLARKQIEGTIQMGLDTGLILPAEAENFRRENLDRADEQLAINRANLGILIDPQDVMNGLAIPFGNSATTVAEAAINVGDGAMPITPEMGKMVADTIGDGEFPADPKKAAAYLKDPAVNAKYAAGVMEMLSNRYDGDISAAVVASSPGGSIALAERWVKSNHDETVLPRPVLDHYRKVMNAMTPEQPLVRLPVVASSGVDLNQIDVAVLDRFEKLQSAYGVQLPVIPGGEGDPTGRTLAVDVKKLPDEERARLIGIASAMGFTGIGIGKDTLTLDAGERRIYAEDGKKLPKWAQDVGGQHDRAELTSFQQTAHAVAPQFAAIGFENRLKLWQQAKQALDQRNVEVRSSIAVAVENAPVAISNMGTYTGVMPTADDFVDAYGAAEGIQRYRAFDAAVDTAHIAFGMKTMSANDIADAVEAAKPTATGDTAALESKVFDSTAAAAKGILDQRKDDPAGYVIQTFPRVGELWAAVEDNPEVLQEALTATAEAQQSLGMAMEILPKAVSDQAAVTFKDETLPQGQRIAAVTQLVAVTTNRAQQEAIFRQLVKSGVPAEAQGAFAVMMRGTDPGAAERLFMAAMVDPDKMPGKLPETDATINQRIQEMIFDEGEIGDVFYGITNGTSRNFSMARNDGSLFTKSVKLRLLDGSARSLDEAIALTMKDRFGDVQVVTGKSYAGGAGMKITLPRDEAPGQYRMGFDSLLPQVSSGLMNQMTPEIAGVPFTRSEAAILSYGRDQYISDVLSEGYFVNAGDDQFAFIDPFTGAFVPRPDGNGPLLFARDAVRSAGMAADSMRRSGRPAGYPGMNVEQEAGFNRRMQAIYGSSFGDRAKGFDGEY